MNDNAIKNYATWARRELISEVAKKCAFWGISDGDCPSAAADSIDGRVLTSLEKRQRADLLRQVKAQGFEQFIETAAYTWFNRILAIRFMEVNDRLPSHVRVLSAQDGAFAPQALQEALDLPLDALDASKAAELVQAGDDEGLFKLVFLAQCDQLAEYMPAVFDRIGGAMELILPDGLLREGGVIEQLVSSIQENDWLEGVEVIGWMYQYYVSERKDEVFASFKKGKKAERDAIAPATQLFTPNWIVRYLTENSLGRLWMLNYPDSSLTEHMPYFIKPGDDAETEFKKVSSPEEITVVDPACGSGHILVYAFDLLAQMYAEAGYSDREAAKLIVEKNLSGFEIDPRAAAMASFAVTMKACELDSRFLRRGVTPQITVLNRIEFDNEEKSLLRKVSSNLELLDVAAHLDECGSLFKPGQKDLDDIAGDLASLAEEGSLFAATAVEKLERLQAELFPLSERYDVVVANPPYMGSSNMNKWLAGWVKESFPDSKRDLCTCFIERGQNLAVDHGYEALITSDTCMYISSFEQLRKNILSRSTIVCFIDTRGANAHPDVFDANAGWVLHNAFVEGVKGSYFKLNQAIASKEAGYLEALADPDCGWFYQADTSVFVGVPGTPIVYWASPATIKAFDHPPLGTITETHLGMATCDNERFLRLWFEVSNELRADPSCFPYNQPYTWFPYNKGGLYRKWYGNDEYLVNWRNDGEELKRGKAVTVDRSLNFRAMVSWSRVSSAVIAVRFKPEGYLFDMTGPAAFGEKNRLLESMAFLNSSVGMHIARFLSATIDFQPGQIAKYPFSEQISKRADIVELTTQNIELSKKDWNAYETSWDFKRHPLV